MIIVDGELSGTGLRDGVEGGYLKLENLDLSDELSAKIVQWKEKYYEEHYNSFGDKGNVESLDQEGLTIARLLMNEIPNDEIKYYSAAYLRYLELR